MNTEPDQAAPSRQRRKRYTPEIREAAERDHRAGLSPREVCERHGMSLSAFYAHIRTQKASAEPKGFWRSLGDKALDWISIVVLGLGCLVSWPFKAFAGWRIRLRSGGRKRLSLKRLKHSDETWAEARKDYEAGFTARAIADRYGMRVDTVKRRAYVEGWSKVATASQPSLRQDADPRQIDVAENGDVTSAWPRIAHAAQLPPEGKWLTWLFQGGRGAGKTRAGAEWLAARAEATPKGCFALVGATLHDVREVMIEGPSGLLNLPGRERPSYEISRRRLEWRNGAVAYAFSAEEPERLRGPQFSAAWADEFCTWPKPRRTLALLRMGLRIGADPRLVVTTTPKPIEALRKLRLEPTCVTTQSPTSINAANLSPSFLEGLIELYGGTRLADQELEGVLLDGTGALWTEQMLVCANAGAAARPEKFDRIVVGVDPPASKGGVCGIIVAARSGKQGFILEDASIAGASALGWAERAAAAARRHGARKIVAEANQGGDMVEAMLVAAGVACPVELVHAVKAKRVRAEPIAALYEQGRVAHCGAFAALEEELMALGEADGAEDNGEGETRLDRADALVWALTALLLVPQPARPSITQL